jgi:hypothetical protein
VATRSIAARIQSLLEKVDSLDQAARRLQVGSEPPPAEEINELTRAYQHWFASALEVLPDDLRSALRREYEGSLWASRIREFLADPSSRNALWEPDSENPFVQQLSPWRNPANDTFCAPLQRQQQVLYEALARTGGSGRTAAALDLLTDIGRRLPVAFAILRRGTRGRATLAVNDEYDVQHILHAIAALHFEEVEPEEPTPKIAGASSRLDFLLRSDEVAIETKMTRPSLTTRQLRSELADDIQYFRAHPNVRALFVFIYDPERRITNSAGFERDLTAETDEFRVRVVIAS